MKRFDTKGPQTATARLCFDVSCASNRIRATILGLTMNARRNAIEAALRHLAPRMPQFEFGATVDHALDSPGLATARAETAAWLALVATIRHTCTDYDDLLAEGYDAESARFFVRDALNDTLLAWGARRTVPEDETGAACR